MGASGLGSPLSCPQSNLTPNGRGMPENSRLSHLIFFGQIQEPKAGQEKMNLEQRKTIYDDRYQKLRTMGAYGECKLTGREHERTFCSNENV